MEIIVKVPDDRADFMLELLRCLTFVKSAKPRSQTKKPKQGATDHLPASPTNAEPLQPAGE